MTCGDGTVVLIASARGGFQRRGGAFSTTVRFSNLLTFTIIVVLCVSKVVFLSPARGRGEPTTRNPSAVGQTAGER